MPTDKILSPVAKRRTMAEEITERVILAIASGEQPPGARLTEALIAKAMDVSRIPAREALLTLAGKGVLEPAGARGLRVPKVSVEQSTHVIEVRMALESMALRKIMGADWDRRPVLAELDRILSAMVTETASRTNALALAQLDIDFHRAIVDSAGNPVLLRAWDDLAPHLLILFCRDWDAQRNKVGEVSLHRRLRSLIQGGDVSQIEAMLKDHFARP